MIPVVTADPVLTDSKDQTVTLVIPADLDLREMLDQRVSMDRHSDDLVQVAVKDLMVAKEPIDYRAKMADLVLLDHVDTPGDQASLGFLDSQDDLDSLSTVTMVTSERAVQLDHKDKKACKDFLDCLARRVSTAEQSKDPTVKTVFQDVLEHRDNQDPEEATDSPDQRVSPALVSKKLAHKEWPVSTDFPACKDASAATAFQAHPEYKDHVETTVAAVQLAKQDRLVNVVILVVTVCKVERACLV